MADVAVFTIGCKVNQAESERLKAGLLAAGHSVVRDAAVDLCVVNTCTVTAESDRKCRKLIRWLAKRGAAAIVAAGCYAEVSPGELADLPAVIRVIPNARKDGWLREILSLLPAGSGDGVLYAPPRARILVKAQDGCERGCSYCIVPLARGRERSRPLREIVREVEGHLAVGVGELVLCGVNLGRYGHGPGGDLARLVGEVLDAGDGFRVRLSSIELEDLRMSWVEDWAASGRVCPHLHLPLQSGDEGLLRDMGRGYGPDDFIAAARLLRETWPPSALTTEVIVGYPGESERAFRHTMEVLEEAQPARVHVFRFSPRPGTRAFGKSGRVSNAEADRRSGMARSLAEELRLRYIEERRGELRDLLVETKVAGDMAERVLGTTEDYIKGSISHPPDGVMPGQMITARICGVQQGRAVLDALERG
jgi:threonylcarbamoyladenosine tRNA methylthiotransferase MtaB